MAEFSQIDIAIWKHRDFRNLSDDCKLLFLYLKLSHHNNFIGCYALPLGYMTVDIGWDTDRVSNTLSILTDTGFCHYDFDYEYVFLPKHLDKNPLRSEKQAIGAVKLLGDIPSKVSFFKDLLGILSIQNVEQMPELLMGYGYPMDTLPNTSTSTSTSTSKGNKDTPITFNKFLEKCKTKKQKPIPDKDGVFKYIENLGLDKNMILVCWTEFKRRYRETDQNTKKYINWRQVFQTCVRENWFKFWWTDSDGTVAWTSAGNQAKKVWRAEIEQTA